MSVEVTRPGDIPLAEWVEMTDYEQLVYGDLKLTGADAERFPQEPGLWDRPCPQCGESTVWVTEVMESGGIADAAASNQTQGSPDE